MILSWWALKGQVTFFETLSAGSVQCAWYCSFLDLRFRPKNAFISMCSRHQVLLKSSLETFGAITFSSGDAIYYR